MMTFFMDAADIAFQIFLFVWFMLFSVGAIAAMLFIAYATYEILFKKRGE